MRRAGSARLGGWLLAASALAAPAVLWAAGCANPNQAVFLTIDTGHMGVAPLVADVLTRHHINASFFVANEPTVGPPAVAASDPRLAQRSPRNASSGQGGSLDEAWAPWWKARLGEGHVFGSHTWDHGYWRAEAPAGGVQIRQTFGPQAGSTVTMSPAQYCAELQRPLERLLQIEPGAQLAKLFRAPGGKTSPNLLAAAKACGFKHVPWTSAGFLGDELSSQTQPNAALLAKALKGVHGGDILLVHLGIWSRQDAWAPAVLEPLVVGLKARGLCFATLREHPEYRAWAN